MNENHTAANVNELFQAVAQEWQLTTTDLVIVRDNDANMIAATQIHNLATLVYVSRLLGRIQKIITAFFTAAPPQIMPLWRNRDFWGSHPTS